MKEILTATAICQEQRRKLTRRSLTTITFDVGGLSPSECPELEWLHVSNWLTHTHYINVIRKNKNHEYKVWSFSARKSSNILCYLEGIVGQRNAGVG